MTEDTRPEEPYVIHATVREGGPADDPCWDILCRFSDGQKFDAIQVDHNFELLADLICKQIIQEGQQRAWSSPKLL